MTAPAHDSDAWETVSGWIWSCRTCYARGSAVSEQDAQQQRAAHDARPVAWWVAAFAEPVAVAGAAPTGLRGTAPCPT
ncbi:hypothetical protein GCM10011608_11110 [Micromonospora sonchi]|uniref:Uncharacterized protein n=1 Tax=Micromonospora sonchi TaxID=1763543 RepID=A0A917TMW6_9ACTN|nr:hypothetical protein GCM10011608_11110 [Micromonospora sonchi]